ncbi:hypothetical protein HDG32_002480 [Paraburkholderia sp. CI2]|nr:hypothetical protein [Paraburkholderia sp. CI2]
MKWAALRFVLARRRPSPKLFHMGGKLGNTLTAYGYAEHKRNGQRNAKPAADR